MKEKWSWIYRPPYKKFLFICPEPKDFYMKFPKSGTEFQSIHLSLTKATFIPATEIDFKRVFACFHWKCLSLDPQRKKDHDWSILKQKTTKFHFGRKFRLSSASNPNILIYAGNCVFGVHNYNSNYILGESMVNDTHMHM